MSRPATTENWEGAPAGAVRVLVECPPDQTPDAAAAVLRRQGYEVRVCEGPDRRHECPILSKGACALVSGADVVVNLFGAMDPHTRPVLGAISQERRPPAIVTEMTTPDLQRHDAGGDWWFERDRVHIVESPLTSATLIDAVEDALARGDRVGASCSDRRH